MTSMTQDFKKFQKHFGFFRIIFLLLKSYHIILKLTAPIGLKENFRGSQIKLSEKSLRFKWFRPFALLLLIFWFLPVFVVFVDIILVVMSY